MFPESDIVSRSETVIVVIELTLLGLVIAAGLRPVDPARLAPETWADPITLVVDGMAIFLAYESFDPIASAAEEVRDSDRTLPRAFFLCVGFVFVLYLLVAAVTAATLSPTEIAASEDYALAQAAKPALGHTGFALATEGELRAMAILGSAGFL